MITLTPQQIRFCINALDINAKDLRVEGEGLKEGGYSSWSGACFCMAENYEKLISELEKALKNKDKRIAIKY